jgi:hypothetical protein
MLIFIAALLQFPPLAPITPVFEESWLVPGDFWLMLVTFILAGITPWLAWETSGLRKDGAKGIEAAIRSAKAAEMSVGVARDMMHNTLRA